MSIVVVALCFSKVYVTLTNPSATRPTHDPSIDTFRVEYLAGPSLVLALVFNVTNAIGFTYACVPLNPRCLPLLLAPALSRQAD